MAIHLKKFENQATYEAVYSDLILPNVALTVDNNTVHYNPLSSTPLTPSHDYVEIAGIKWATMNVGATSITDTGLYFQWGDTQGYTAAQAGSGEGQKYFGWANYKYGNGTSSPGDTGMTKYNSTDGKTVLDLSDDAARANMGGLWRMPTTDEYATLVAAVNSVLTNDYQDSGVAGLVCTDKTDSSNVLFFPAAGYYSGGGLSLAGEYGLYWSATLNRNVIQGRYLYFGSGFCEMDYNSRCYGLVVRGVLADN